MDEILTPKKARKRVKKPKGALSSPALNTLRQLAHGIPLTAQRIYPHGFRYWLGHPNPEGNAGSEHQYQIEISLAAVSQLTDRGLIAPDERAEMTRDVFRFRVTQAGRLYLAHGPAPDEDDQIDLVRDALGEAA